MVCKPAFYLDANMAHRLLQVVATGLAVLFSSASLAEVTAPPVRFCFNNWVPYAVADDTGIHGITVAVLTEAARRADLAATFEELPWKRCLEMVRQGRLDAVVDAADRPEFLQGPASYSVYTNTIWVGAETRMESLAFEALSGKKMGLVDGYSYPDQLMVQLQASGLKIDYSVDDATNIRKLAFGRVDSIVGDFVGTLLFAREHGLNIHPLTPNHSFDRLYPSFNKTRADLQRAIDKSLAGMIADGSIDRIYRKHIGIGFEEAVGR